MEITTGIIFSSYCLSAVTLTAMASESSLPTIFQKSYLDRNSYPKNLIERTISSYPTALAEYYERLKGAADDLCEIDVNNVDVLFRDLQVKFLNGGWKGLLEYLTITSEGTDNSTEIDKYNIHSPDSLTEWLGVATVHHEDEKIVSATKQDPKCRFMFVTSCM